MIPPKEPKFSDIYQPSEQQKQGEIVFVDAGAIALEYAAFRFLYTFQIKLEGSIMHDIINLSSSVNTSFSLYGGFKLSVSINLL